MQTQCSTYIREIKYSKTPKTDRLLAPTAGLLQGLTLMQQCVHQIKFRNVCEVKE